MKNKILQRIVSFILLITIFASFLSTGYIAAASSSRPKASELPTSTLIIGTHIISITGLNSELLAIALDSGQNTQQDKLFYKSEFADGTWFDISNSSSFNDISSEGIPVGYAVIDALILTHWTKEDGKTYDLSTNLAVDIHKIDNPSNFSSLSELGELKTRREMLIENIKSLDGDAKDIENSRKSSIERIILVPFKSTNLENIVKKMDSLENYINYLKNKKAPEDWIDTAVRLKGDLNILKYIECYYEVLERLNNEISYLDTKVFDDDDKKVVSTELTASYYSCLDVVNKKIAQLETSVASISATSYIDKELTKYSEALVAAATKANSTGFAEADKNLEKYMSLENILKGLKLNIPLELSILKPLETTISNALFALSSAGAPTQYTDSQKAKESKVVLTAIKNSHISNLDSLVSELQSVIGYINERDSAANKESLLASLLKKCLSAISKVPTDDLKEGTTDSLKKLLNWLNSELALIKQHGMDSTLIDKLKELDSSISELSNQYLSALDNRELDKATSIKDEINNLTNQKSDIYGNALIDQGSLLKQKSLLESQFSTALAKGDSAMAIKYLDQLSTINASLALQSAATDELTANNNNSLTSLVAELKVLVNKGKNTDALQKLQEISELSAASPTSSSTLQSLLKELLPTVTGKYNDAVANNNTLNKNNLKDIKTTIESLLDAASNQSSSGSGSSGDGSSGSGSSSGNNNEGNLSALLSKTNALLSQFGVDGDSSQGQLIKLVLLNALYNTDEYIPLKSQIKSLQDDTAKTLELLGSKYISYKHMTSGGLRYISLKELSAISSRRYVWNAQTGKASIVQGTTALVFGNNSSEVNVNKSPKVMPAKAFYKGDVLYVPLAFTTKELNFSWTFIGKSSKLLVYPKSIDIIVQKMLK